MTTCAASGCTARPAARGLCTRHLGLNPTGPAKKITPQVVFVDKLPDRTTPGRGPHPIDVMVADELRQHPGRWAIYPAEARWADAGDLDPRAFAQRLHSLKTRITKAPTGVWRDGRYDARVRDGKLFVRYTGDEEAAA